MLFFDGGNLLIWGLLVDWVLLVGVYLSLGLDFLPVRLLPQALQLWWRSLQAPPASEAGEASPWQTSMAALGGLMGLGNITGMAVALTAGGPGALVWVWLAAVVGLATKFCETLLSAQWRQRLPSGHWLGGPMLALRQALPPPLRSLGTLYALAGVAMMLGPANALQSQQLAQILQQGLQIPPLATGLAIAALTYGVIVGGLPRIGRCSGWLLPLSCGIYAGACLLVILSHAAALPAVVAEILEQGLSPRAITAGTLAASLSTGIRFAVLDSEAGMGTTATLLACGQPAHPFQQACIAMVLTVIDVLIGTGTALVILLSGSHRLHSSPIAVVNQAFAWGLGDSHGLLLLLLVAVAFAFTTITAYAYFGERCLDALTGGKGQQPYRLIWIAVVVLGSVGPLDAIWRSSDLLDALITLPNLVGLVVLSNRIFADTRSLSSTQREA